ncbi:hypothetical protein E2562_029639 [Oryza meyeriana var. granulata]|uniref:Integrase catalytic domain-containing protein n=1 Tax=Oryza meyeriana var. granulata TaxID=110450 RepID=A0A6G1FDV1_9ORYZ|nr:hypothetical protein E2562_029639 [Oryza meyeriana var. granulata]
MACVTCQQYKADHLRPAGLLQPLPVPSAVWADIGIDFIEALPKVQGKTVILSVVDRFSKYCHFIPLAHPYTAESVAHAFFADIVRLHGVPQSIVSDRDPVFTSAFWQELMRLTGTKLYMSCQLRPLRRLSAQGPSSARSLPTVRCCGKGTASPDPVALTPTTAIWPLCRGRWPEHADGRQRAQWPKSSKRAGSGILSLDAAYGGDNEQFGPDWAVF